MAHSKRKGSSRQDILSFVGQKVVLDTDSSFVYLGTLKAVYDDFFLLENVDVHDKRESAVTKEVYIMDAKKYGIRPNRKSVWVRRDAVLSVSHLDDVIEY
jgi:hypothetical protein